MRGRYGTITRTFAFQGLVTCQAFALWLLTACGLPSEPASQPDFVGGSSAAKDGFDLPGAIAFDHCGATKIAERFFLTAGHCAVDRYSFKLRDGFRPGEKLLFAYAGDKDNARELIVKQTLIDSTYAKAYVAIDPTKRLKEVSGHKLTELIDIALIEVESGDEGIASASLSQKQLRPNDEFIACGWGFGMIDEGPFLWVDGPTTDLSYARVKVKAAAGIQEDKTLMPAFTFATGRNEFHDVNLSLADGDSGSAAYVEEKTSGGGTKLEVIGVNSYSGGGAHSGIASLQPHTRTCIDRRLRSSAEGISELQVPRTPEQAEDEVLAMIPTFCPESLAIAF